MKHLTIIASGITLISSYSLAMEYNATFNNNLSNETIIIFNAENGKVCSPGHENTKPSYLIGPKETKKIPLYVHKTQAMIVITTNAMDGTSYILEMKKLLPKNINFTHSYKQGHDYINILYDDKLYTSIKNEHRDWPGK